MKRYGASPPEMRELFEIEIFFSRLKLLIIMSKAYLEDYPLGRFRKKAIIQNARQLSQASARWEGHLINYSAADRSDEEIDLGSAFQQDYIFHQRVRLLAVMAKAFAEGNPVGHYRKRALEDNINFVCETIGFNFQTNEVEFLKVA